MIASLNSLENKNDTLVNNNWVESLHDLSYQYLLCQSYLRKETFNIYFGGWVVLPFLKEEGIMSFHPWTQETLSLGK